MKEEKESKKSKKGKKGNNKHKNITNIIINNTNNINKTIEDTSSLINDPNDDKKVNEFHHADELQKKEIKKIIRSKYSSQLLSFNGGLSEFSHLAISYYFKDSLKLSPSQSSFYRSLISLPFIFQPLFGLISDLFPIFGYKRKTYLIIGGGLNFLLWSILSFINSSQYISIIFLIIISLNNTFINACSGGILLEVSGKLTLNHKKLERYNASYIYQNVGMIMSSLFRGIAIELLGVRTIFIIAGALSLFNVIAGVIYFESVSNDKEEHNYQIINNNNEEESNNNINNNSEENKFINFLSVLNNKNILIPLILILFFSSSPSYFESAFYYLTDVKKYNARNFGQLTICMMILMLSNSIIYKRYLKDMNKKKVILWSGLISFFSSCFFNVYLTFNLKSKLIVFLSISLYVSVKTICSKPMQDIIILTCPKGFEGSVSGLIGSALSFGKTISTFLGSLLTMYFKVEKNDYSNFNLMIFVNNIISLLSLLGLFLIDDELMALRGNKKVFNFNNKPTSSNDNEEVNVDIYNEESNLREANE